MQKRLPTFSFYLLIIFCAGFSLSIHATPAIDTLVSIKQLQFNAEKALEHQDYLKAVHMLHSAHRLAAQSKYREYRPEIELNISELCLELGYLDRAQTLAENSIAAMKKRNKDEKLLDSYLLYGRILCAKGDYRKAEEFYKKADSINTRQKNGAEDYRIVHARGILELSKNDYQGAINLFKQVISLAREKNDAYLETSSYTYLADALSLINPDEYPNSLEQATQTLDVAMEMASSHGFSKFVTETYRIRSQIYIAQKKVGIAEKSLRQYLHQIDSIKQIQLTAIIETVQAETAIQDLNAIIATQKDDLSKQEKSLFFGKLTGWLSVALILILSLLTLSLYKNNNLRAKANDLLQEKNTELQQAKESAEKASQAKAHFLSTITHELRTPMYTVTGLTHLLLEENPKPEQREHLNSLKFSGEYLLSLINNILDLNKLEASKVELEKMPFNLRKRVDGVLISLKKAAQTKNNSIHLEYDQRLPEEIIGDSLKLSQILINLISNSIKFTEDGNIWVRIKETDRTPQKVTIFFEVEDTGDGISKKKQNVIFESFSQGSLQINRKYGGTGLGLSIVKNLLELMGSKIHLESKLGEGSKFWFSLDYNYVLPQEPEVTPIREIEVVTEKSNFAHKSVLIVEDNKINQMITKKILDKKEMVCTVADNGTDAVELVKKNHFDVILMDIHMPGISGIEATKKIREFNTTVPIIALTAVTIEENLEEFYKSGFSEFIPKPFKAEDFFEKISKVLNEKESTAS